MTVPENLKAGFAQVEITPPKECPLIGYNQREELHPSGNGGVNDPLYIRALILENSADGRFLILSLDLAIVETPCADELRRVAAGAAGLNVERVMVSCTHTHSGPYPWRREWGQDGFEVVTDDVTSSPSEDFYNQLVDAVARAAKLVGNDLSPAKFRVRQSQLGFAYKRRVATSRGIEMCWNPKETPHLEPEPADDSTLVVLQIQRPVGDIILFNVAGHPVTLGKESWVISADWPGAACRLIEQEVKGSHAIFMHGAGGDAHPWLATDNNIDDLDAVARPVAGLVSLLAQAGGDFSNDAEMRSQEVTVDYSGGSLAVSLWKLGPACCLAFPGELFGSTGLQLRGVTALPLLLATTSNGWLGYWPPSKSFEEGAYEVDATGGFGVTAGDAELVVAAVASAPSP